ncbi:MAG: hypothetical protein L0I62_06660 [Gammaproteobacteria bacterium]|nr:hypothetical protein [Gammaproteobacteria bacterium]
MRGKIIQYNGADGTGTLVAEGKQHPFALAAWRGDRAPAVNKTVDVELDGETVTAVRAVGEDLLMKERAAQMGSRLGAAWNRTSTSIQTARAGTGHAGVPSPGAAAVAGGPPVFAARGAEILGFIVERYGFVIPIAWLLFLIGSLAFSSVSASIDAFGVHRVVASLSMFSLGSVVTAGFVIKILLILSYISIAVPLFWRHRYAWLTLLLPFAAWLVALLEGALTMSQASDASPYGSVGFAFGFWWSLVMAVLVAVPAVMRFLESK